MGLSNYTRRISHKRTREYARDAVFSHGLQLNVSARTDWVEYNSSSNANKEAMSGKDTITKELFASLVLNIVNVRAQAGWTVDFVNFAVSREIESGPQVLHLTRLYHDYLSRESPTNFQMLTKHIDALLTSRPLEQGDARMISGLLPCLRTYITFQQMNESYHFEPSEEFVYFPYADVLGVGLVIDKGETQQHLRHPDLEKLNLTVEEAVEISVNNLEKLSTGSTFRIVQPGFYTSPWKDLYDGARLMLTDLFSNLEVKGEIVALSPAPDALFVTGSQDAQGLELLVELGHSMMDGNPNSVAAWPLVLRDGIWQPFTLPADDPAFNTINFYRLKILEQLYQAQATVLADAAMKAAGTFVAPFVIDQDEQTEILFSKTSVLEDTVCIVPEADVVEFFRRGSSGKKECVGRAPFGHVALVMNQYMLKDPAARPVRWHLSTFPSEAELNQIGMMPALRSPIETTPVSEMVQVSRAFGLPLPAGARPHSQFEQNAEGLLITMVVNCTPAELKDFHFKNLPVGNMETIPTEQGEFHLAEMPSANCVRMVVFGPSKIAGECIIEWLKSFDYNNPSIINAFAKQSDEILSLEQIFGISIIPESRVEGELRINSSGARQDFISSYPPEAVCSFFRCQMSALKPIYMPAEDGSPHLIMAMDKLTVAIRSGVQPEGTLFNISREFKSNQTGATV